MPDMFRGIEHAYIMLCVKSVTRLVHQKRRPFPNVLYIIGLVHIMQQIATLGINNILRHLSSGAHSTQSCIGMFDNISSLSSVMFS